MTLIISEVSEFGVAMVADSAVTCRYQTPSGITKYQVLNGAQKLQIIPYLNAGISMWGAGIIPTGASGVSTDVWIEDFVQQHTEIKSIHEFAEQLSSELQRVADGLGEPVGFHLGGYMERDGRTIPVLYHVRNCDGNFQDGYKLHEFIPGQHFPSPEYPLETLSRLPLLRNGDYGPYALLVHAMNTMLPAIQKATGRRIPHASLHGRIAYHAAWIRFVSDLYASARELRIIGGSVWCLAIPPGAAPVPYTA